MPVNGYTVGRDVTITLAAQGGTSIVIASSQVTQFDAKPAKKEDWSRPLNLPPMPIYIPDGWTGTVTVDRQDDTLDAFQASLEANFWAGGNTPSGTILETITESNGSVTQWQYNNAMFWVADPGRFQADGKVSQTLDFCSGTRVRIT
jgi:hypothetical protein